MELFYKSLGMYYSLFVPICGSKQHQMNLLPIRKSDQNSYLLLISPIFFWLSKAFSQTKFKRLNLKAYKDTLQFHYQDRRPTRFGPDSNKLTPPRRYVSLERGVTLWYCMKQCTYGLCYLIKDNMWNQRHDWTKHQLPELWAIHRMCN